MHCLKRCLQVQQAICFTIAFGAKQKKKSKFSRNQFLLPSPQVLRLCLDLRELEEIWKKIENIFMGNTVHVFL